MTTLFQKACEKALNNLEEEDVKLFLKANDDIKRIELIYKFAKNIEINPVDDGKDRDRALEFKEKGNNFYGRKCYDEAIEYYNRGIVICPQDSENERELLSILISNRSACFFELKQYEYVFNDIDYVLYIGNYPLKYEYKLWLRKAKCYDALQNERYSKEAYNLALESLKHSELSEKARIKKIEEIKIGRERKSCDGKTKEIVPVSNSDQFVGGNKEYISAHKAIIFDYTQVLGRFARAIDNIESGVIILEENPHCAVVSSDNVLSNCQYCCTSTNQPVACPYCGHVVFCSLNCERQANSTFHRYECKIQPILFRSGASINCSMAMRIISQKPHQFFHHEMSLLKDYLKDCCKKTPIRPSYYQSNDYNTAFFLCRNENLRRKEELVHYSCMAIYLTRLLAYADYFPEYIKDALNEDQAFIASLILRHLQILQFNSHEISEIRNNETPKKSTGIEEYYKNVYIGAGLYPTLALFNHSCDPSIIRYNIGNKMVVRTIKPIKSGDIIYENYGPLYTAMEGEKRRAILQDRYWFECFCTACQDDWPLFEKMNDNQIKIACKTENCPYTYTLYKDDFVPFFKCEWCNNTTMVFPNLKALTQLETLLPQAENFYHSGEYRESIKTFRICLDILFKYSEPPCPDMVKAQQRLRTLLVHLGNKRHDYVQKL